MKLRIIKNTLRNGDHQFVVQKHVPVVEHDSTDWLNYFEDKRYFVTLIAAQLALSYINDQRVIRQEVVG